MRRLDRYVLSEVSGPLALGFLVYTFILLLNTFFGLAEMIIRRGVPTSAVAELLLLSLPNIVVVTLPMALLLGTLIAVGRLAADSELVALRASGLSLRALARPLLLLGGLFTLLNAALTYWLLPAGNAAYARRVLEVVTRTVAQQVEPRVFYSEFKGKVLYVFDTDPGTGRWRGVFLSESIPGARNEVTTAESGEVRLSADGERLVLRLEQATKHTLDLNTPAKYDVSRYRSLDLLLRDSFTSDERARMEAKKGLRELAAPELRREAADPENRPETRNLARVEIHKRFAIAAACLVFAFVALPLGYTNRRGGRSSGFAISIGIIIAYHLLLSQGEEAARVGELPPAVAMWLPNLLLACFGLYSLARRDRDLPLVPSALSESLARLRRLLRAGWSRLAHLGQGRLPTRSDTAPAPPAPPAPRRLRASAPRVRLRLPRPRWRFPNLLDRYALGLLGRVFLLVLVSGVAVSIVADLSDNLDDILKNDPPSDSVIGYYKYLSLQIAYNISPIAVLMTTLIGFSLLSRTSEVTAMKALGISLFRLAVPAVLGAVTVALAGGFLQSEVLAASNQRAAEYKDRIRGSKTPRAARRADQQWLIGEGQFVYNYLHYDPRARSLQRLQVFQFDEQHRLIGRLFAERATAGDRGWIVEQGWARSGGELADFVRIGGRTRIDLPEDPAYFAAEVRKPREMSYAELRNYVSVLRASGQAVPELEVALADRFAFPFTSVAMALVALPFAFRLGRQGALYGLGIAVALAIVFFAIFALFRTFGEVGVFPALVAVWSPTILFGVFSLYLFLGVRS